MLPIHPILHLYQEISRTCFLSYYSRGELFSLCHTPLHRQRMGLSWQGVFTLSQPQFRFWVCVCSVRERAFPFQLFPLASMPGCGERSGVYVLASHLSRLLSLVYFEVWIQYLHTKILFQKAESLAKLWFFSGSFCLGINHLLRSGSKSRCEKQIKSFLVLFFQLKPPTYPEAAFHKYVFIYIGLQLQLLRIIGRLL